MIPGPIEVSAAVQAAYSKKPPSHVSVDVIQDFAVSLGLMRQVWCAGKKAQPFVVAGSGTLAMEMAVTNLIDPGDAVLVASSGYFSERMAEMLRRRGASVLFVAAEPGDVPSVAQVEEMLRQGDFRALFATHVDTSTGVRVDAANLAAAARRQGVLSVFDGVCSTAGERFEMKHWGADVFLSASQKAIGLPAGLGLMVVSERAMQRRRELVQLPPLSVDWLQWLPIMEAYEARKASYFSTPATQLIGALLVGLSEIVDTQLGEEKGMEARFQLHARAGGAMRAAWKALELSLLPARERFAANTMSAIRYPKGVDASLLSHIRKEGVIVAGGLLPGLKDSYFRVGHMGYTVTQPAFLEKTVSAVEASLTQVRGQKASTKGLRAFKQAWSAFTPT